MNLVMIVIIMVVTNEGQISVDFLLGISIFLLTFGFVIQFIPGLFLSTSGGGSLDSVVYRTANILTEDPGWWQNNTQNGTNWEMHTDIISRIGLAADATPKTRQTRTPRMLNMAKIEQMKLNEAVLTTKLGLYYKISGAQVNYSYNITIKPIGNPMTINGSNGSIPFGDPLPSSQDVYKITRLVLVERGNIASFRADELTANLTNNNAAMVNISGNQSDVIIQITDFNITNPNASFDNAKLNNKPLTIPDNYIAYNRTNISDFNNFPIPVTLENNTDTLRLIFNKSLFNESANTLELDFNNITFNPNGSPVNYSDRVEPLYEPATLVVEAWS